MINSDTKFFVGFGAIILGIAGICMIGKERSDIRHTNEEELIREHQRKLKEIESTFPPEYWTAKAAEHEASVKKHEIDVAKEERLIIDQRNREDAERAAKRDFEKNAPAEYWEQKRIEAEEVTKRRQIQADEDRSRRLDERERDIAAKNADALVRGARSFENAMKYL